MGNYSMPGYFQNMTVLKGAPYPADSANAEELKKVEQDIHERMQKMLDAGITDESIHKKGQYTAMERVLALVDEGTFLPLNSLYNPEDNDEEKIGVISTGIVKGLGRIGGKWAVVIASDNKKIAGAWVAGQADNLLRGSDTAKMLGIPLVYLLNCSGVKLDEQEKVYPNRRGGGTSFYRNSELNQMGVPVIVGIYGTNPAGGGYHSISPTILIAHKDANMAVGGAGIVGGMDSKMYVDDEGAQQMIELTKQMKTDPPGSVHIHYNETGFFREVYAEELGVIDAIKKYMNDLPAYNLDFFRVDDPKAPAIDGNQLYDIVKLNTRQIYDMYNVLRALVDGGEFMEYKKGYGPEMITGLAKIDGLLVGIVANQQGLLAMQGYTDYPEYRGKGAMGVGGKLYRQGLIKMNEFVALCARDKVPMIWIQDTSGIDVDNEAEKAELLGLGQSLIYSIQDSGLPMLEITLRKGTAAAHYVLGGPPANDNNVFSLGTAATEINVMYGKTAAGAMYSRRLVKEQDSGKDIHPTIDKMNELIKEYYEKSAPAFCAKAGMVDEVVDMPKIRDYFVAFADAAYQNPKAICPFHQMLLPRIIRDFDALYAKK
ncbi:MAG: glutaconyl-CoA decarboxylase subunit alpha [Lachnospiraceae bacterium]|nr:glutaconyl-CoA decarboxylase subunit alpha [Lachnospiraceae bacterium]